MWEQSVLAVCLARRASRRLPPPVRLLAIVAAVALLPAAPLVAANVTWTLPAGQSGDWFMASNWSGAITSSSDAASILNGGTATISQPGAICGTLSLGGTAGGNVQLTTGDLAESTLNLGSSGKGSFTQSGGTNAVSGSLYLGSQATGSGSYNLTGPGCVSSIWFSVGRAGAGMFLQAAGTNVATFAAVGDLAASSGSYNLTGPGTFSTTFETIAASGTGTFTLSDGANIVSSSLTIAQNAQARGTYNLGPAGLLSAPKEYVGNWGAGSFIQTGGTNTVGGDFYLGVNAGGSGTYSLGPSGQLSARTEYISSVAGATALFQQTGGLNSATTVLLGTSGRYQLGGGGTLAIDGSLVSQGVLDGSGGAGVLTAAGPSIVDLSQGTLQNTASTVLNLASSLLIVAPTVDPTTAFSGSSSLCLVHTAGTTLTVPAGQGFGGLGTLSDPVVCEGTIAAAAGGAINLPAGLQVSGTGIVALGNGTLTANGTTSGLSGGSLAAASLYVGNGAAGLFTQSGGTCSTSNTFLAYNPTDSGTYSLTDAGHLSPGTLHVGYSGTATFAQTSGTVAASFLNVGERAGSSGNYSMSGPSAISTSYHYIGLSGTGVFTQTDGTVSAGFIHVGDGAGGSGSYTLNGTGIVSTSFESIGVSGTGIFTQNGGSNSAVFFNIAEKAGSLGTYNLNSGTLAVGSITPGSGTAVFNFNGGTLKARGTFATGVPITLGTSGGSATIDTSDPNYTVTLSGPLTGPGGLVKTNSGTLLLSGTNDYGGDTVVNAGRLTVNGSLVSPVTVNPGGILGGTGSLTSVTVSGSARLAPGGSPGNPGVLQLSGGLTLQPHAILDYELDTSATSDAVYMPGQVLTLGAQEFGDFHFTPLAAFAPGQYVLIDAGSISGTLGPSTYGLINGMSASLVVANGDLVLDVVPEPSAILLLGVGTAGIIGWAWRRRCLRGCLRMARWASGVGLLLVLPSLSEAADVYWQVSTGDWSASSNWGGALPNGSNAYIINGGTATITSSGANASALWLGGTAGGTVHMIAGSFSNAIVAGERGSGLFVQSGGAVTCGNIYVGEYAGDSGSYELSGSGTLSASILYVADGGTGTFTQTGGSNTVTTWLFLDNAPSAYGTYNLAGGRLKAPEEYVGSHSNGGPSAALFRQTGGINTATYLCIDTLGSYQLNGGTLQINGGLLNTGSFDGGNSPATISVAANTVVNFAAGAFANVSATSVTVGPSALLIVPDGFDPASGFKSFQTQGITHTAGTTLTILPGQAISGWGAINDPVVCQGTITAPSSTPLTFTSGCLSLNGGLVLSGSGLVNLGRGFLTTDGTSSRIDGGSLTTQTQYVGYSGWGTLTQTAGANSVGQSGWQADLHVGYNPAASGTYTLSGGQLTVWQNEYIGYSGTGTFTQSGGTHTLNLQYQSGAVYLGYNAGSSGTYSLSGTGQMSALCEYVARPGTTGLFQQSGGSNTVQYLSIGSGGQYQLSGGTLRLTGGLDNAGVFDGMSASAAITGTNCILDFALGTLRNTQSISVTVTGTSSLVILPAGFNPSTGFRSFHNDGTTHTAGTLLTISAGQNLTGWGSIGDLVSCSGTIAAALGGGSISSPYGAINMNGGLVLSGTASANLGMGTITANGTASLVSSGSLKMSQMFVGRSGTGTFTQTGGTINNRTNPAIYLGYYAGDSGTYSLSSSGQINNCQVEVGLYGTGHFTQDGGAASGAGVELGVYPGSAGTYDLRNSGYLASPFFENVGVKGTGTFTQSGGTNTTSSLRLGGFAGASGTYNLNGGLLTLGAMSGGSGTAVFNFSGGTVMASAAFSSNVPITLGASGGGATIDTGSYGVTFSGVLGGSGALVKIGTGILTLTASNTYTGLTTISAGTLQLGNGGAGGSVAGDITDNATLAFNRSDDAVFGGVISGTGRVTKVGMGTLALAGTSTYSGPTAINAGCLAVNGSLVSPVTVNASGILSGTGSLTSVTVSGSGHIAPGNLPGSAGIMLLSGSLTLQPHAIFDYELDTSTNSDAVLMPGRPLTLGGQEFGDFNFTPLAGFGPGVYTLIDAGSVSGSLGPNTDGAINGLDASLAIADGDLVLNIVPEPSTFALLFAGVAGLLGYGIRIRR